MKNIYKLQILMLVFISVTAHAEINKILSANPTVDLSCEEATNQLKMIMDGSASSEQIIQITTAINKCSAIAFNKKQQENGSSERALVTASLQEENHQNIMLFNLVSINPNDIESVRLVCKSAATAAGVILGNNDPILTPILSKGSEYSCDSYIKAAQTNNSMLIIAPTLIPGLDVTKDALRLVGVSEEKINDAEKKISETANKVGTGAVQSGVAIATGGLVQIDSEIKCVTIFGKRVCR